MKLTYTEFKQLLADVREESQYIGAHKYKDKLNEFVSENYTTYKKYLKQLDKDFDKQHETEDETE